MRYLINMWGASKDGGPSVLLNTQDRKLFFEKIREFRNTYNIGKNHQLIEREELTIFTFMATNSRSVQWYEREFFHKPLKVLKMW